MTLLSLVYYRVPSRRGMLATRHPDRLLQLNQPSGRVRPEKYSYMPASSQLALLLKVGRFGQTVRVGGLSVLTHLHEQAS